MIDRRSLLMIWTALVSGTAFASSAPTKPTADSNTLEPLPDGATSQIADVNGISLHFVSMGSGPAVLLLHGWPQTWFSWREVMPRLAKTYRVIAPDLRGTGLSERTQDGYDKKTIAEDMSALMQFVGIGNACIVGHDMGGKAAYVLAHLHPQIVSKLVLVDCLIPGTENLDALRGGAWHYGFHIARDFPEMLTKGREREYIAAQIKAWSRNKDAIGDAAISEYAKHYAKPGGMTAGFNYYRALRDDIDIVSGLRGGRLEMPVLTMTGEFGVGSKLADSLKEEAGNLTSVIVPGSGHFVAEEAPDAFCSSLEAFLSS